MGIFKKKEKKAPSEDEIEADRKKKESYEQLNKEGFELERKVKKEFPVGSEVDVCGVKGVVMASGVRKNPFTCYNNFLYPYACACDIIRIYFPSTDKEMFFSLEQLGVGL